MPGCACVAVSSLNRPEAGAALAQACARNLWGRNRGGYHELFMHFGDSIFIFLLALVLFGPKKLPEIGRQVGKLLAEFRRASNEFKFQIQEELRNMEEDERRKKLAERQAEKTTDTPESPSLPATEASSTTPSILPPSTGTPVSTSTPWAAAEPGITPVEPEPTSTVEPSAAEVVVDPPASAVSPSASVPAPEPERPAPIDLNAHTNGTHPAADSDPAPANISGETLHHG